MFQANTNKMLLKYPSCLPIECRVGNLEVNWNISFIKCIILVSFYTAIMYGSV